MNVAQSDSFGPNSDLLTFKKACARITIPQTTGRFWLLTGRFPEPALTVDNRSYWRPADIDAFMSRHVFTGEGPGRRLRPKQAACV